MSSFAIVVGFVLFLLLSAALAVEVASMQLTDYRGNILTEDSEPVPIQVGTMVDITAAFCNAAGDVLGYPMPTIDMTIDTSTDCVEVTKGGSLAQKRIVAVKATDEIITVRVRAEAEGKSFEQTFQVEVVENGIVDGITYNLQPDSNHTLEITGQSLLLYAYPTWQGERVAKVTFNPVKWTPSNPNFTCQPIATSTCGTKISGPQAEKTTLTVEAAGLMDGLIISLPRPQYLCGLFLSIDNNPVNPITLDDVQRELDALGATYQVDGDYIILPDVEVASQEVLEQYYAQFPLAPLITAPLPL